MCHCVWVGVGVPIVFLTPKTNMGVNAKMHRKTMFSFTNWMMSSFRALLICGSFVCFLMLSLYLKYLIILWRWELELDSIKRPEIQYSLYEQRFALADSLMEFAILWFESVILSHHDYWSVLNALGSCNMANTGKKDFKTAKHVFCVVLYFIRTMKVVALLSVDK